MQNYKIVFSGSMGAGKSRAIRALSDTAVLSTEQLNTDLERHSKAMTTVGMDYGQLTLSDDLSIGLYGTPGQERFEFMWPILLKGALGVVIVIDHYILAKYDKSIPMFPVDMRIRDDVLLLIETIVAKLEC